MNNRSVGSSGGNFTELVNVKSTWVTFGKRPLSRAAVIRKISGWIPQTSLWKFTRTPTWQLILDFGAFPILLEGRQHAMARVNSIQERGRNFEGVKLKVV
jgi:hypothetical protein